MIQINNIVAENLYSQRDASFLLGNGFTKKAARQMISEACREKQLNANKYKRQYWFTGADFLEWVEKWFNTSGNQRLALSENTLQDEERQTDPALEGGL